MKIMRVIVKILRNMGKKSNEKKLRKIKELKFSERKDGKDARNNL